LEIVGGKASLACDDFVVTAELDKASYGVLKAGISDKALTFSAQREVAVVSGCVQHTKLIECMSRIVASGERDEFWSKAALQTQRVLLALEASARKQGEWVPLDS